MGILEKIAESFEKAVPGANRNASAIAKAGKSTCLKKPLTVKNFTCALKNMQPSIITNAVINSIQSLQNVIAGIG